MGISFSEWIIIFVVVAIVIGPERAPAAGKLLARGIKSVRTVMSSVTSEFREVSDTMQEVQSDILNAKETIISELSDDEKQEV